MKSVVTTAALLLCLAAPALAVEDCAPSQLRGTWRFFAAGDNREEPFPFIDGYTALLRASAPDRVIFERGRSKCVNNELQASLELRPNCTLVGVIFQDLPTPPSHALSAPPSIVAAT
jgi:hypothetical protein